MRRSDALWEVFKTTGHIGAYLLYKGYEFDEDESGESRGRPCCHRLEKVRAE